MSGMGLNRTFDAIGFTQPKQDACIMSLLIWGYIVLTFQENIFLDAFRTVSSSLADVNIQFCHRLCRQWVYGPRMRPRAESLVVHPATDLQEPLDHCEREELCVQR